MQKPLLRIRISIQIRRIHVFGPPRSASGSISQQAISKKNIDSFCFVTSSWLFIFEKLCKCTVPSKSNKQKNFEKNNFLLTWRSLTKIAGSGPASISQRYGFSDPDPCQNFMDPQHWQEPHLSDCDDRLWMLATDVVLKVIGSHRRCRRQQVEQLIIAAMELAR